VKRSTDHSKEHVLILHLLHYAPPCNIPPAHHQDQAGTPLPESPGQQRSSKDGLGRAAASTVWCLFFFFVLTGDFSRIKSFLYYKVILISICCLNLLRCPQDGHKLSWTQALFVGYTPHRRAVLRAISSYETASYIDNGIVFVGSKLNRSAVVKARACTIKCYQHTRRKTRGRLWSPFKQKDPVEGLALLVTGRVPQEPECSTCRAPLGVEGGLGPPDLESDDLEGESN